MSEIKLPHCHDHNTDQMVKSMPDDSYFDMTANIFSLISDSSRMKILWLLCHAEECVVNIAAIVGMSSPAVSHHLRVLKQAGILTYRKEGKEVYYTLADTPLAQEIHKIVDVVFNMNCCNQK